MFEINIYIVSHINILLKNSLVVTLGCLLMTLMRLSSLVINKVISFNISKLPFSLISWTNVIFIIHTIGGHFTWHRGHNDIHFSLRSLIEVSKCGMTLGFSRGFCQSVFCKLHSNHNPLLIGFGGLPIVRGPKPFRFEAVRIDHIDYSILVERVWTSSNHITTIALNNVRQEYITFKRIRHIKSRPKEVQYYLERVDSLHHILLECDLWQEYNHIFF
jgi:hypothetical protein